MLNMLVYIFCLVCVATGLSEPGWWGLLLIEILLCGVLLLLRLLLCCSRLVRRYLRRWILLLGMSVTEVVELEILLWWCCRVVGGGGTPEVALCAKSPLAWTLTLKFVTPDALLAHGLFNRRVLPKLDVGEVHRFLWLHVRQVVLEILIVLVHVSRLLSWSSSRFLCVLWGELLFEYLFQDVIDVFLPV